MAQPNRIVINIDDYLYDHEFQEGKLAIFPIVISSDSEEESDRDESPCPSPPCITDSDDEYVPETPDAYDEDYVPGTPQDWVPETPLDSDDESINLPIDEAAVPPPSPEFGDEDAVPPPSPEFGGSSPEL